MFLSQFVGWLVCLLRINFQEYSFGNVRSRDKKESITVRRRSSSWYLRYFWNNVNNKLFLHWVAKQQAIMHWDKCVRINGFRRQYICLKTHRFSTVDFYQIKLNLFEWRNFSAFSRSLHSMSAFKFTYVEEAHSSMIRLNQLVI